MYFHHFNLMALMNFDSYESAADYFAPEKINLLFLAESPPSSHDRYFYYPCVQKHDWLWIGLMKAIYGGQFKEPKKERGCKMEWLKRFQCDGYRLIDAVKKPISSNNSSMARKKQIIRSHLGDIDREIRKIKPKQILLVTVSVYDALYCDLIDSELPVVNGKLKLPFPGRRPKQFQSNFEELVKSGEISLT